MKLKKLDLFDSILIVTDHGAANIEQMMDEALEDLPGLVSDIKEELRCMHTLSIAS